MKNIHRIYNIHALNITKLLNTIKYNSDNYTVYLQILDYKLLSHKHNQLIGKINALLFIKFIKSIQYKAILIIIYLKLNKYWCTITQ